MLQHGLYLYVAMMSVVRCGDDASDRGGETSELFCN